MNNLIDMISNLQCIFLCVVIFFFMHVKKIIIDNFNNSIHLILIEILEWKIIVKKLAEFPLQKMKEIKFYHIHIKYRTKITKQNKGNKERQEVA